VGVGLAVFGNHTVVRLSARQSVRNWRKQMQAASVE